MHFIVDKLLAPLDQALAVDAVWRPIEATVIRFARGLRRRRTKVQIDRLTKQLQSQPEVRQGRFAGMKYATVEATCSAVLPKLIGTYEAELDAVFEQTFAKAYEIIVDVGCAEGYYAVGLARKFPSSSVFAYDIDPHAQELCSKNAAANGVADRVQVNGGIMAEELAVLVDGRRCLVVCDCEGWEKNLFTAETLAAFKQSDLIIETHDFIHLDLCNNLSRLFAGTHQIERLNSIDDLQKAESYQSELVNHLDAETKVLAYGEGRPEIMTWIVATPLSNGR